MIHGPESEIKDRKPDAWHALLTNYVDDQVLAAGALWYTLKQIQHAKFEDSS